MTRLRFSTKFTSPELRGLQLPLEVRSADQTLIGRVMTSESIDVEPGMYVVSARMPAGQEIRRIVEVGDKDLTVDLVPPGVRAAAVEVATFLGSSRARVADVRAAVAKVGPAALRAAASPARRRGIELPGKRVADAVGDALRGTVARLRGFAGNPLAGTLETVKLPLKEIARADNVVQYHVQGTETTTFLQLLHANRPPVNIALPLSGRAGCIVALHREAERVWVEVHVDHSEAGLLLGYQQSRAGSEEVQLGERLLRQKLDDPIAAAIGAYSLLRFGRLDALHDWTENLKNWFRWLPDGAAVRGEHLARLGRHGEALETFVGLPGLPVFSDGVAFVWERVRLYGRLEKEFPADLIEKAKALQQRLAPFIGFINFDNVVTTFTGLDPARPDAEVLKELPAAGGGAWDVT